MRDRRYRRWDEILNPALERSMKREHKNPYEKEILKALEDNMSEAEDRTGIVTGGNALEKKEAVTGGWEKRDAPDSSGIKVSSERQREIDDYGINGKEENMPAGRERKAKGKKGEDTELEGLLGEFIRWKESMRN